MKGVKNAVSGACHLLAAQDSAEGGETHPLTVRGWCVRHQPHVLIDNPDAQIDVFKGKPSDLSEGRSRWRWITAWR